MAGVAGRQHLGAVLFEDALAHSFCRSQNTFVSHCATKRRTERDYRRDIGRSLTRNRPRNYASQAVADYVDSALRLFAGSIDGFFQSALDQQVWALRIQSDAGKIRTVPDPLEPGMHFY